MSKSSSTKELRQFGILIGIVLPLLIGWTIPTILGHEFREWTLWIGIPILLIGILSPKALRYPYEGWIKLGHVLGFINSHIILSISLII